MSFSCPLCHQPLSREKNSYICPQRHQFDMAKEGYVNLLPVQHKRLIRHEINEGGSVR